MPSPSQHQVEEWIQACVFHLQENSAQYFSMISEKGGEGVLWAVFHLVAGIQVVIKRASYLSLSTMRTTKAQSLLQMHDACDVSRQFVCWFTLEDGQGTPLTSKVMIVDVAGGRTGSNSGRASPAVPGTHPVPAWSLTSQLSRTPTAKQAVSQAPPPPAPHLDASQDMQHVLRVALQVADSVATLSTAVENLQRRIVSLEESTSRIDRERITTETLSQVLHRVLSCESRIEEIDNRTRTFSNLHEQMFQQFTQLKRDVLQPSATHPPGTSSLLQQHPTTPVASARPIPSSRMSPPSRADSTAQTRGSGSDSGPQVGASSASDGAPESLSDMIKVMEEKLQRIRLPAK